ncbi:hypothetical protein TNCT6_73520 [Streptomyces sp. 6-11-2]|nr:hypothetical protein TNCT6_73520 [Streptomyces sp. 6-11-2]
MPRSETRSEAPTPLFHKSMEYRRARKDWGNSACPLGLGDGPALAMDAGRDLRAPYAVAERRGPHVAFAADTHPHAGFLSGAVRLGHDAGATVLASAAGHRAFAHTPPDDGDEVDLGKLTLRALATPGAPTSPCRTSSWAAAPHSACSPAGR